MRIIKTKIQDLVIIKQRNNIDNRGSLRETFNNKILKKKFIFEYCTTSKKNVLRGIHFQSKFQQAKYVNVVKGKILDVVVDLRKESKTFGKTFKIILSKENALGLYIPAGFGHAYYSFNDDNVIYYKLDNYYMPKFENGIIYNDKNLNLKWPKKKMEVSKKDKNLLTFENFCNTIGGL
jgi:dTDP-4-dehydrorhamnose 3,5-epimerase